MIPADALERVGAVVAATTGLRPSTATEARLVASVQRRTTTLGVDPVRYPTLLAADPAEQQALVELLSVQETSWFRDPGHFDAVVRLARAERHRPVVVWSAGTATGAEAWSLAIALHEGGVTDFQVVASDIADVALARSRRARYDEHELRGLSPARRSRYLARGEVVAELRNRVRFVHHNVATDPLPVPAGTCTAVFCRNVFIYLGPGAVASAIGRFHDALVPGGHLFVGVSETLRAAGDRFELVRVGEPFAYRRRGEVRAAPRPAAVAPRRAVPAPPVPRDHRADGEVAARAGDHARAAAAFRAAAYHDPDDVLAHFGLGLALEGLGERTASRRAYAAARAAVGRADADRLAADLEGWGVSALLSLLASKLEAAPCP